MLEILLELVLLVLLLHGPFRKYLVFSVYIFTQILTQSMVASAYFRSGFESAAYRNLYWTDEISHDLLLFLVVISFTYQALNGNPLRPKAAKALGVIVAVGLALPFSMLGAYPSKTHGYFSSQWFNHVSQIYNFAAAIMNLVLWMALLSNRRRDPQLVVLSIGLGIVTASAAIAWGLRQLLDPANRWPLDIFMALAQLVSLVLWCRTFRRKSPEVRSAPPNLLTNP